ncbi:hypothetical protein GPECTOR_64g81 [Gonium pectorale]|uniref:Enhancer of mRNA-decapping protein 4 WD40 repeat region domain-containing protein n=1 Tax=Gonium pectorale TaxID=33097 RepID=A0A150G466_GONPE|nr:hypothetical protein GPECTOR_64g81 [Gonium pectorale]|eukprot:KXZ44662.1 hypothetical protein GPECTOR_64g81 [Gonium pectorale]
MAPGFELMGWLKGAQPATSASTEPAASTSSSSATPAAAHVAHPAPGGTTVASGRLAAPQSHAAAALAAALSAGGVPERKHPQPQGAYIAPDADMVTVDAQPPASMPNLMVSGIANVKSEIARRHGRAIAADANLIVYALRGGQLRVINRHTGVRTLLKDHAAPVTDLRFFAHDSSQGERCLLASLDAGGQVHVRKIFELDTGGEDTIRHELLATHALYLGHPSAAGPTAAPDGPGAAAAGSETVPARLAWHPSYDFVLAVAAGPALHFINVPPTPEVAAAAEYAVPVTAARSASGAVFTSLAFSPAGDMLAAGDAAGWVTVWPLRPEHFDPALIQPLDPEPLARFQAYGADGAAAADAVASLHWLPLKPPPTAAAAAAPPVLLTGDAVNAHLQLWALGPPPRRTHALRLVGAGGASGPAAFFNHLDAQPLFDCVVLANELRPSIYVLHASAAGGPQGDPVFDYVSDFSVKTPILSCALTPEASYNEATDSEAFPFFTIQADSVQQYTLVVPQCFPVQPHQPSHEHDHEQGAAGAGALHAAASPSAPTAAAASESALRDQLAALRDPLAALRDPLAALLSAVQQRQKLEAAAAAAPPPEEAVDVAGLASMASDVSDATSPPLAGAGAAAAGEVAEPVAAVNEELSPPPAAALPAMQEEETEQAAEREQAFAPEAEVEAGLEAELEAAVSGAAGAVAAEAEEVRSSPAPPPLLTPSQLMQSAAAAVAAARSVSSGGAVPVPIPSAAPPLPSPPTGDAYSVRSTVGGDSPVAGGSFSSSELPQLQGVSPSRSEGLNMSSLAEAGNAGGAAAAIDASEASVASTGPAAAALLPLAPPALELPPPVPPPAASQLQQQSPANMPPQPSELLARRISQGNKGGMQPPAHQPAVAAGGRRPQSAPPPLDAEACGDDESGAPSVTSAPAAPPETAAAAAAAATLMTAPPPAAAAAGAALGAAAQEQLAQLLALQQQLMEQVAAGQRELLKQVRSETLRSAKAAADAAASRTADAMSRRAAEERRRETAELQRALTSAVSSAAKDISQRVADAAASTAAAVQSAIGPAVKAALAEALPPAMASGPAAAALERALGSQLGASLPRAVQDGLGAAFASQVVPPLERATSTMFGQMEAALRAGLDTHLAPLSPLAGLGSGLRDAAAQGW